MLRIYNSNVGFSDMEFLIENISTGKVTIEDRETHVFLWNLEIKEKYRGKGFGKILIQDIFNYVKENYQVNEIKLFVRNPNIRARNLYEKFGFQYIPGKDDKWALQMSKKLEK